MKINKGDFIDSRQFSREECERFIKLAVESGYTDAEGMIYYGNTVELDALGVASTNKGQYVPYKHIGWGKVGDSKYGFCNNISRQFREFLDKEDSVSKFKIGDKVKFGSHPYVVGHEATGVVTGKANYRGDWQVDVVYGEGRFKQSLGFYEHELELCFSDKEDTMKNAPKDATHYGITSTGNICFYKLEGDKWYFLYANAAEKGGVWCMVWDNKPSHTPLTEIKKRELGWCLAGYSYPSHTPLTEIKRQFTKADLLDGMRVTHEDGTETIVVGNELWVTRSENYKKHGYHINLSRYHDDLTGDVGTDFSIEKVTDRDGTVVFEREQPKKKVTLELTDEQIAKVKAQFML